MIPRDRPDDGLGAKDSGGLRFETVDDARNYARNVAKSANNRYSRHLRGLSERYIDGDLQLQVSTLLDGRICKFVFLGVPLAESDHCSYVAVAYPEPVYNPPDGRESPMNFCIPDLVETPEKAVAAFLIWFEIKNIISDTWGDVDGSIGLGEFVFGFVPRLPDGEFCESDISLLDDSRGVIDRMVERGAKTIDGVERYAGQFWRNFFSESQLKELFSGVRVHLGGAEVRLSVQKL